MHEILKDQQMVDTFSGCHIIILCYCFLAGGSGRYFWRMFLGQLSSLASNSFDPRSRHKNLYDWSFIVEEIDQFLSHSWHGNHRWKVLMLILVKNGLHACILGTLAALFLSLMVLFHLVPEMQKFAVFDSDASEPTSVWSLTTGMLVASATLILRRPQHTVFLDTICIDQTSAVTKAEGVLNMGAFLRSSKSMLVLWDSSYALRWGGVVCFWILCFLVYIFSCFSGFYRILGFC